MTIPQSIASLAGTWAGPNQLWLHNEPMRLSDSTAVFTSTANGKFMTMTYTWADNGPQDGLLVIGSPTATGEVAASWIDSWHMGEAVLQLSGVYKEDGSLDVFGNYPAPPDPDWGWRIVLRPRDTDAFDLLMFNATPDGDEEPATEANYRRQ